MIKNTLWGQFLLNSNKAIVLLNMGGISKESEIEVFLNNMFNDKNIITTKINILRKFIAYMIIITRKNIIKKNYEDMGYSTPILKYTKKLAKKISKKTNQKVYTIMRYTPPFSSEVIKEIQKDNIKEVFLLPMYPQYSTTTTKSSIDDFMSNALKANLNIKFTFIHNFYENKLFLELIVDEIIKSSNEINPNESTLVFSAHSLPEKIIHQQNDPYQKQLEHQVELLTQLLKDKGVSFNKTILAYQSKVTPFKWLSPSIGHILHNLYSVNKKKNVIIYPISFMIDNAESLYELGVEYEEIAKTLNFDFYKVVKCPNYDDNCVDALCDIMNLS